MPVTLIGEAVFARCLSALKSQRVAAAKVLTGPSGTATEAAAAALKADKASFIESIRQALLASKIVSYAQVTGRPTATTATATATTPTTTAAAATTAATTAAAAAASSSSPPPPPPSAGLHATRRVGQESRRDAQLWRDCIDVARRVRAARHALAPLRAPL